MTFKILNAIQQRMVTHRDEDDGATMVEYGLMVSLIAVVVAVAVGPLGTAIAAMFVTVTGSL